ncbi:DinB superfamily protein [Flavobacterium swingsii]|uniref:DinB superfamily protein n=1 Tax=Flavobacterium swingsii TaxID=498292 RepID=A0A1I0YIW5_9FLAO|nr:DinB family protein [Flavobacterium swingsii]SFB13141.1 DinB superfamily protein [Flavobacterium swingsii]
MQSTFEINKTSRNLLLQFLENHSLAQLNKIPEGFANNIIWNIGHIVTVQQMLVYKLSGLGMMISDEMVDTYKKGTKPEREIKQEEVDEIKKLLFSTLEQTKEDFANDIFDEYMEFTTGVGFTIKNAKSAVEFNNYHEALHTGIMMQIKKFI